MNTTLSGQHEVVDEHAEHRGHHGGMVMPDMAMDLTQFDGVLSAARNAGIDAGKLEIRPAKTRIAPDRDGNRSQLANSGGRRGG